MAIQLEHISSNSNWGNEAEKVNLNNDKIALEFSKITEKNRGYFHDSETLILKYPNPESGWYAFVGSTGSIWEEQNGVWIDSGEPIPADFDWSSIITGNEGNSTTKVPTQKAWTDKNLEIKNSIPEVVSTEGNSDDKVVSQKAWTDKNAEITEEVTLHVNNINVHFDTVENPDQHLDLYTEEGTYRVKGLENNGLALNEAVTLYVTRGLTSTTQTIITSSRYKRRTKNGALWGEWLDVIQSASATRNGLMPIDHFIIVEDMKTNFEGLVQSQTEIKQSIDSLKELIGVNSGISTDFDTRATVFFKDIPEGGKYIEGLFATWSGVTQTSVIRYPAFSDIREGIGNLVVGGFIEKNEPVILFNNEGVDLSIPDTNNIKSLQCSSNKLTGLNAGNNDIEFVDLKECIGLQTISMRGSKVLTLDLSTIPYLINLLLPSTLNLTELKLNAEANIGEIRLTDCSMLRLSGVTFPTAFRPQTMSINGSGFTYEDVVALVDKYANGGVEQRVSLWIDKDVYLQLVSTGDEAYFSDKYIDLLYNN